jgi:hypothetical protein
MHPYASAAYAVAFAPQASRWLPNARTHVLLRPIPGTAATDAMGCYPLCVFESNDRVAEDFAALAGAGLVSLVLVTDCLTQPGRDFLDTHFDHVREYKTHYLFDCALGGRPSKHHRDGVRRANRACTTRVVDLAQHLDGWGACYDTLRHRKGLGGLHDFSRAYFQQLARLPELVTIASFVDDELVSAHLFLRWRGRLYSHLAASSPRGYEVEASFAIYAAALERFGEDHVIDFGGGAGLADAEDGLAAFKRGFANSQRRNFVCGKTLDPDTSARLAAAGPASAGFFPAYRAPRP